MNKISSIQVNNLYFKARGMNYFDPGLSHWFRQQVPQKEFSGIPAHLLNTHF